MSNRIQISIPKPCYKNWAAMNPTEKGRFCASCQKQVMDFTTATDREIYSAFQKNNALCGRFNNSQLNRELTFKDNKNKQWLSVTAAILSFFAVTTKANAQKAAAPKTHMAASAVKKTPLAHPVALCGKVTDTLLVPLENVFVGIKGTVNSTATDSTGAFYIKGKKGDILVISVIGFKTKEVVLETGMPPEFILAYDEGATVTAYYTTTRHFIVSGGAIAGISVKRKSFFGRLLQKVVTIFKHK